MTELEVLQNILDVSQQQEQAIEYLIGLGGVFIGLVLALLFAIAWGRNSHV